jgi:hypothetical protein
MSPEFKHLEVGDTLELVCQLCNGRVIVVVSPNYGEYYRQFPDREDVCHCHRPEILMITHNPRKLGIITSET